jgi:hypothetical protein
LRYIIWLDPLHSKTITGVLNVRAKPSIYKVAVHCSYKRLKMGKKKKKHWIFFLSRKHSFTFKVERMEHGKSSFSASVADRTTR